MEGEAVIGLDVGTTNCKAIALDRSGKIVADAREEYGILEVNPGWFEQDPEEVLNSVKKVLHSVSAKCKGNISAIGISVQGEAVIPLSREGKVLHRAILGMDRRCSNQNKFLRETFGDEELYYETGMPISTINTLPKIMWIKDNLPELFEEAHHFVLYEDFLTQWLTGELAISDCLASRTQLFSIEERDWSEKLLNILEKNFRRKLSKVVRSGEIVGKVRKSIQKAFGFKKGPLVVAGGHDQACASLGAGVVEGGNVLWSTGTADVVEMCSDVPVLNSKIMNLGFSTYIHCAHDKYLSMYVNHVGGITLKWLRDLAGDVEGYEDLLDASKRSNSLLPIMVPLVKEDVPFDFLIASGLGTSKYDLALGIVEGLTYHIASILRSAFEEHMIKRVVSVGGGAKSRYWNELKSSLLEIPIVVPSISDTAPIGAAILTGIAVGFFKSVEKALEKIMSFEIIEAEGKERLREKYQNFWRYLRTLSISADKGGFV